MGNPTLIHLHSPFSLWMIKIRMRKEISDLLKFMQLSSIWVNLSHLIPRSNPTKVRIVFIYAFMSHTWLTLDLIRIRNPFQSIYLGCTSPNGCPFDLNLPWEFQAGSATDLRDSYVWNLHWSHCLLWSFGWQPSVIPLTCQTLPVEFLIL